MNSIWIVIHKRFRKDTNPTDLGLPQKFSGNTIIHGNPVLYLRILPTKPIACSWATHRNQSKKSLPYFHALSESKVLTWGALLLRVTGPVTPWHMHQATEVLVCCCMKSSLAKIVWYKEMHLYTHLPSVGWLLQFLSSTNVGSGALDFSLRLSLGPMEIHWITWIRLFMQRCQGYLRAVQPLPQKKPTNRWEHELEAVSMGKSKRAVLLDLATTSNMWICSIEIHRYS